MVLFACASIAGIGRPYKMIVRSIIIDQGIQSLHTLSSKEKLFPTTVFLREVVVNILLTMPFGFLIDFITPARIRKIPLLAFAVNISIEIAQLFLCFIVGRNYRGVDINDALMNMMGFIGGYGCFCVFIRLYLHVTTSLHQAPKGIFAFISMIAMRFYQPGTEIL